MIDNRGARAVGDGIPSAQDPRRPGIVALQYCRGGERDQRVDERELVVELPDVVRLSRTNAIASCASPRCTARKARTYSVHDRNHGAACRSTGCGLVEQALRLRGVAGGKDDGRHPGQRMPEAPRERQCPEPFNAAGEVVARRVALPTECSMSPNMFSARATITTSPVS